MEIRKAKLLELDIIKNIVDTTVLEVYSKYYPIKIVEFFMQVHSLDNIKSDIINEYVYLIVENNIEVGTITILHNEINRLFIKPSFQKKGYGTLAMDFAESMIYKTYNNSVLDASLPGVEMYLKRGYQQIEQNYVEIGLEAVLYHVKMEKYYGGLYDRRIFTVESDIEVKNQDSRILFRYYQKDTKLWIIYSGGNVFKGHAVGYVLEDNSIEFTYHHIDKNNNIVIGFSKSIPEIMVDGRIRLKEKWEHLNGDRLDGETYIIELE